MITFAKLMYAAMAPDLLRNALELYNQGRLPEAQTQAEACLRQTPDHPEARRLLAVILAERGHPQAALEHVQELLRHKPTDLAALATLGAIQRRAGQTEEAEQTFRQALTMYPDEASLHSNLGNLLMDVGRREDAIASYHRALECVPDFPDALYNLAGALQESGDLQAAAGYLERSLAAQPDPQAAHQLGLIRAALGRPDAREALEAAVHWMPGNHGAHFALAGVCQLQGDTAGMRRHFATAIHLAPDESIYRVSWMKALSRLPAADVSIDLEPELLTLFADQGLEPAGLLKPALQLLATDDAFPLFDSGGYRVGLDADSLPAMLESLSRPLFLAMLQSCLAWHAQLERLLRDLRRALLELAGNSKLADLPPSVEAILAALATQVWLNEYVWPVSAEERTLLERLGSDRRSVLAAACYRPVTECDREVLAGDAAGAALVNEQLDEMAECRKIAADMPVLGDITDAVSRKVRAQYEENPYPRWHRTNRIRGRGLAEEVVNLLPHLDRAGLPTTGAFRILNAGCGTGRGMIETAYRFPDSEILAVDISRASLAYAKQRSDKLGLEIEFLQADILALGALDRRFDLIESSGVLHHMEDPEAGWRVLTGLLEDRGLMRIGLYSRIARANLDAARELIESGPESDADQIRAARDLIFDLPADHPAASVRSNRDFYSLSACRDALFHVQEQCLTLPEIAAMLERLQLRFLGFELPLPQTAQAYRQRFPDDPSMVSLDNWHVFEQANPTLFAGMYQFWVQRK
jgi:Flp pilus assembly protein TadD/SAM-dependent methyltransferase